MSLRGTKQSKNLKKSLTTNNKTAKLKIVGKIKSTTNYINPIKIFMNNSKSQFELGRDTSQNLQIQAEIPMTLDNGQTVVKQIEGGLSALHEAISLIAKKESLTVAQITNARYRVEANK
jgi:hypothetical protein